ncbi:MAG TPA: SigB/SigF/SigG family RNA polymerase sigma factor [Solirubrobacteraceae bacterium]
MSTATSTPSQQLRRAKRPGALGHVGNNTLFVAWQQGGDRQARDELVQRFLPLARKLARRYSGAREPFDDLLQVASLGLVKAIDRYDLSRGTAFSSFAVPTILGELKRYFRDLGWAVHVPRGAQERAVKVEEAQQLLSGRLNRAPTVPELAQYLEFAVEDVLDALETSRAHHAASLDAPYDDGEGESGTMVESFGHLDPSLQSADDRMTITGAARQLPQREREVLALRFVHDLTQTQIADHIGVSQMQVSRILRRAIAHLTEITEG